MGKSATGVSSIPKFGLLVFLGHPNDDDGYELSHVEVGGGQERMEKVENGNGAGVPLRQGDHLHHRQGDC